MTFEIYLTQTHLLYAGGVLGYLVVAFIMALLVQGPFHQFFDCIGEYVGVIFWPGSLVYLLGITFIWLTYYVFVTLPRKITGGSNRVVSRDTYH